MKAWLDFPKSKETDPKQHEFWWYRLWQAAYCLFLFDVVESLLRHFSETSALDWACKLAAVVFTYYKSRQWEDALVSRYNIYSKPEQL